MLPSSCPRSDRLFSANEIVELCRRFESLGTLDVALGGGEPTLHTEFALICRRLWDETGLGVSFTTHGHHLTQKLVASIRTKVSFVRVSVDGIEPLYSFVRKRPLSELLRRVDTLRDAIPFGFNVLITTATLDCLDGMLELAISCGAHELLLLPVMIYGRCGLTSNEWTRLDNWIRQNFRAIPLGRIVCQRRIDRPLPLR